MQRVYQFCVIKLAITVSIAQSPALLKDIYNFLTNCSITGSANYKQVGTTVFFTANDGINAFEWWKTDGKAVVTAMVKDINPGQQGSQPANLTNVNGVLYFAASGRYSNSNTIRIFIKAAAKQPVH